MKKVVIVTNIPSPYRVDFFYFLQNNYKQFDFEIIYTSYNEDNRQWNVDESKIINSYVLKSKVIKIKLKEDYKYIHLPSGIFRKLYNLRPDVIIACEYNVAAIQSLIWARVNKIPYIHLTDGTLNSERNINTIQKLLRKIVVNHSSSYIASSSKAKEKLLYYGANEKDIFVSFLSIDDSKIKTDTINRINGRILYVGSLVKRKGIDLLLDALAKLNYEWNLHIVGNGSKEEKEFIQYKINQLNINDKIKWCGFKEGNELYKEYLEASVFILPTREDCYGLVLLEAFLTNTPIVASKYADGAYDIVSSDNGIIVDPYNVNDLKSAIETVLSDKNYLELSKKNDKEKFKFKNVSVEFINAVENVLKNC